MNTGQRLLTHSAICPLAALDNVKSLVGSGAENSPFAGSPSSSGYKPLPDILNLPENMQVTGGPMVGYPMYTY